METWKYFEKSFNFFYVHLNVNILFFILPPANWSCVLLNSGQFPTVSQRQLDQLKVALPVLFKYSLIYLFTYSQFHDSDLHFSLCSWWPSLFHLFCSVLNTNCLLYFELQHSNARPPIPSNGRKFYISTWIKRLNQGLFFSVYKIGRKYWFSRKFVSNS